MSARGTESLGTVYAEALAEAADAQGLLEEVGADLETFAAQWRTGRELEAFFRSGAIRRDEKSRALDAVFRSRTAKVFGDFLQVLLKRNRMWLLPRASDAYGKILDRKLGRVPVRVVTAAPVSDADLEGWRVRIRAAIGKEPVLSHEVRPALIGGAVIRVGDTVADGSVRRRLLELRARIASAGMANQGSR